MRVAFNKPNEKLPLYCDSIGYHWRQPAIQRLNGYHAYHWLQTESGAGIVTIAKQTIMLKPKQAILFRPRIAHRYQSKNGSPWQTAFLTFDGLLADQLADFLQLKEFLLISQMSPELISFIPQTFSDFSNSNGNIISMLDQSVELYHFLMLIRQNALLKKHDVHNQTIALPIVRYIAQHYAQPISNAQLAKMTRYSITYQNRIFKKIYNVTPLEFLNNYRMRKAKQLLVTHPDWGITRIASQVGFHDPSHFIEKFKQSYQATPAQFRKWL